MRTSRPATARYSVPSTRRFARSVPNARKRLVESAKSNGSGKGSSDIAQRVVPLEGHAFIPEVLGEAGAREDTIRGERGAAVGPAVADEDERLAVRKRTTLALVAADLADTLVAEDHTPPVGAHLRVVRP